MAQEYGIFMVRLDVDYKPDTGEYVATVTAQVEAVGISKRIRRQVVSVTLAQVMELVYALFRAIAIGKGIPVPEWAGGNPEGYTPTHTGVVAVTPILSGGVPTEPLVIGAWLPDTSIYGPPPET